MEPRPVWLATWSSKATFCKARSALLNSNWLIRRLHLINQTNVNTVMLLWSSHCDTATNGAVFSSATLFPILRARGHPSLCVLAALASCLSISIAVCVHFALLPFPRCFPVSCASPPLIPRSLSVCRGSPAFLFFSPFPFRLSPPLPPLSPSPFTVVLSHITPSEVVSLGVLFSNTN